MKKQTLKLIGIMIALLLIVTFILPTQVLATGEETENKDIQIVKTAEGKYIIYAKGVTGEFKYGLSTTEIDPEDELAISGGSNSVLDSQEESHVAVVNEADNGKHIYIKTADKVTTTKLNLDEAFTQENMNEVKTTTERINTTHKADMSKRVEMVEGTERTVTTGGLEINTEGTYEYTITKVPSNSEASNEYRELMDLAKILENANGEYDALSKYEKLETEKRFYNLYNELKEIQEWKPVEEMKVLQPEGSQDGDEYIVFLKEVDENGNAKKIDAKFMVASRAEDEGVAVTESQRAVKETAKLPITGDSLILFAILAVIILVAIVVFIRMKKLQGKSSKH